MPPLTGNLKEAALRIRKRAVKLSAKGSCFLGSALSVVDIIVALYGSVIRFDPKNPYDMNRDRFVLSKGHAVPALYGLLVELGLLTEAHLEGHLQPDTFIYWHPNEKLPGIDVSTGSLGQGFSIACGLALGAKIDKSDARVFVVLGDGELQEGVIWESALFSSKYQLGNLIAIIDRNKIQANIETEKLMPLEPLDRKWESFGWKVIIVDGHDIDALKEAYKSIPSLSTKPHVIIAETVRGKGIPSIEGKIDKWIVKTTEDEALQLIRDLDEINV